MPVFSPSISIFRVHVFKGNSVNNYSHAIYGTIVNLRYDTETLQFPVQKEYVSTRPGI